MDISNQALRDILLSVPQLKHWPELKGVFPVDDKLVRLDWQLPATGCEAVGGKPDVVLPAVAAMAAMQVSIILVDDMLDEEPDGEHIRLGIGRTANLALALQAAALELIGWCKVTEKRRAAAVAAMNRMALNTAAGQELDVRNLQGEKNYWRVVRAKSTPFYGAGLEIGALLGGGSARAVDALYQVGVAFGEAIQVFDDLEDAFQMPANSDWAQERNNLVLLFGREANYPEKEKFLKLKARAADPVALEQAQQVLISSGAVSFCAYQIYQRHRTARKLIAGLRLKKKKQLDYLLKSQLRPFLQFLRQVDEKLPEQFLEWAD